MCVRVHMCVWHVDTHMCFTHTISHPKPQLHFCNSGASWLIHTILALQAIKHMVINKLVALNMQLSHMILSLEDKAKSTKFEK